MVDETVARLVETIRAGRHADLLALLEDRFESHGDIGSLLLRALQEVLLAGDLEAVERLAAAMPSDFALRGILSYGLCHIAAKRLDLAGVSRHVREAMRYSAMVQDLLAGDREFGSSVLPLVAQHAFLYEPPGWDSPDRIPEPDFNLPEGEGLPVVVGANGLYFDRFFPAHRDSFLAVAEGCRLHAHVVNPTDESRRIMAESPGVTFSTETADWGRSYYANTRLLILGRVLDKAEAAILSDIDVTWRRNPADLMGPPGDFGFFPQPSITPNLIYHAQLLTFRDGPAVRAMVADAAAFIRAKLKEYDVWMVDQTSLMRAVMTLGEALKVRDLNGDFGSIEAFHELQRADRFEKYDLRQVGNAALSFEVGPDGKPKLSRS